MSLPVRANGLLALGAFIPLVTFLTGTAQADLTSGIFTGVNVLLITGSLFVLFGGSEAENGQENGAAH
ncbi:hypothetical protein ACFQJ7_04610 [Halovenus rubra]|uniref:Uncharacterized protein n=2 Tax=Halovenus rubra TaxID=869890 RepID=A0ACC7DXT6_9EURY|nr:hypothetical protein [Halovenus rubra]